MPVERMGVIAQAYLREKGSMPQNRDDQHEYSWFRFGFEAGVRHGMNTARDEMKKHLEDQR